MKYLIGFMVVVYFMVCFFVGCSPYRSKSLPQSPEIDSGVVDYDAEQEEFEEMNNTSDHNDVYHVKYVHITL